MDGRPVVIRPESPAPGAPLGEVGALGAEGGVLAVAGIEPGGVWQRVEHPGFQVVQEAREVRRRRCPSRSAGKQRRPQTVKLPTTLLSVTEGAAIYCRISEDPRALEKGVTR
jgi:hypothetical protein